MPDSNVIVSVHMPWNRATMDVRGVRQIVQQSDQGAPLIARCWVNVMPEIEPYPGAALGWADAGPGTHNLAANILDRFLPPRWGECSSFRGFDVHCRAMVLLLMPEFVATFLEPAPFWEFVLYGSDICRWIQRHATEFLDMELWAAKGGRQG